MEEQSGDNPDHVTASRFCLPPPRADRFSTHRVVAEWVDVAVRRWPALVERLDQRVTDLNGGRGGHLRKRFGRHEDFLTSGLGGKGRGLAEREEDVDDFPSPGPGQGFAFEQTADHIGDRCWHIRPQSFNR